MVKSLSDDLRGRVIHAVEGGMTRRAAALRYGVSPSSAVRWVKTWRDEGSWNSKHQGGDRRSHRIERFAGIILEAIAAKVDTTLDELVAFLRQEHGQSFARSTLWRFLDRHAMTLKKNGSRRRADQARRRRAAPDLGQHAV